jgi:hypothetical protein
MPLLRLPNRPTLVTPITSKQTLYAVTLSATPSLPWRAAFLRPPPTLLSSRFTPELGRLQLDGATVLFRTTSRQVASWLRRIDRWIEYANSVVEE